ncbi:alpha-2,8-polysialyltransferase family protein [Shewanella sp. 10N.7]|uniref:alpha-2,8-polysialyltransferase family protein n=1 Tax=Shewanella sp. 10N.7 TaxID=2885093 RepID=UPI001E432989|nr:alpha-2,8-polysialyltransferase family protein [Shewanella sp. 10N.7]MCC4831108.1 alpha-2,8-polysialyltransferase family protein [Shewanella sp. 10N.7]
MKALRVKNVYFVESPLQLMSALEAVTFFKDETIIYYKLSSAQSKSDFQMIDIIKKSGLNCFSEMNNRSRSIWHISCLKLLIMFLLFAKSERVFIGDFRNFWFNILAGSIRSKEVVLLDDGASTIYLQYKFFSKGKGFRTFIRNKKAKGIKRNVNYIFSLMFNDKVPNLFSFFNFDGWLFDKQIDYCKVRKTLKKGERVRGVYFLGSKLSEAKILNFNQELKFILFTKNYMEALYPEHVYVYVPHRSDSEEKLIKIHEEGIRIKKIDVPIEIYFDSAECLPSIVCGFYTTALYTLNSGYCFESVISFDVSKNIACNKNIDSIRAVYSYYKSNGILVVPIKDF